MGFFSLLMCASFPQTPIFINILYDNDDKHSAIPPPPIFLKIYLVQAIYLHHRFLIPVWVSSRLFHHTRPVFFRANTKDDRKLIPPYDRNKDILSAH